MDIYSQHHLKRAATEPEHLIRKAEFDLAVERISTIEKSLDVRPGHSGSVLDGKSAVETSEMIDMVSSPLPTSVSENARITDDFNFVKTLPLTAKSPMVESALGDDVASPLPENVGESIMIAEDIETINVSPIQGYSEIDFLTLSDSASISNDKGTSMESTMEMIPVDQRCYFDKAKKEFVFEYVKNTGVGTVKSVCVGRSHANKADKFSVALAETAVPPTWQSGSTNYLLEHTADQTFLWKTNGSSATWRNDLSTRSVIETIPGSPCAGVVGSYFGGLVAGNVLYKAAKQSASGDTHVVRLTYINNFRTSTTAGTKDITFTCREGMTVNTAVHPILVMRPDRNKLEIFVTLTIGDHDGTFGCNVQKAVIGNLNDPANLTVEIVDLGILPYAVSNWTSVAVAYYLNGFFHDGKYYLPVYAVTNDAGLTTITAESAFQTGMVVSEDFSTVHGIANFRTATANEVNAFVLTDGGVVQCRVNSTTIPYVHLSQVVSGSNLPQAVTKSVDDVLRIIYRYRLS